MKVCQLSVEAGTRTLATASTWPRACAASEFHLKTSYEAIVKHQPQRLRTILMNRSSLPSNWNRRLTGRLEFVLLSQCVRARSL